MTLDGEVWKTIEDFPFYDVSDAGRVRSWYGRGTCKDRDTVSRLLRFSFNSGRQMGYAKVALRRDKKAHDRTVHTLILQTFVGPRPEGMQAAHLNGDSKDNRLLNLKWVTPSENMRHKELHGTKIAGSKHPRATLTEAGVLDIVREFKEGRSIKALSEDYSVPPYVILSITKGKSWSWLTGIETQITNLHTRLGRACKGETNGRAKLSEADVIQILEDRANGASATKLMQYYGIGKTTIYQIFSGKLWSHIPRPDTLWKCINPDCDHTYIGQSFGKTHCPDTDCPKCKWHDTMQDGYYDTP